MLKLCPTRHKMTDFRDVPQANLLLSSNISSTCPHNMVNFIQLERSQPRFSSASPGHARLKRAELRQSY